MKKSGFTLIELMIAVVIIAILAAMAYPSYQKYVLRSQAASAEAEMQRLAQELERFKSRNFSFKGFSPTLVTVGSPVQYTISIVAAVDTSNDGEITTSLANSGSGWIMKASPNDIRNFTYLYNSQGIRCRNKINSKVTFTNCGGDANGSENW